MELVPMFDQVVIKQDEAQEKTEGGILLPEVAKDRPKRGTVLAVGPTTGYKLDGERLEKSLLLKKGDRVVFGAHAGSEVDVDGKKLLIMKEDEILAIVRG